MKTVKELIEELQNFSEDYKCYAYEGEFTGIVIVGNEERGEIELPYEV